MKDAFCSHCGQAFPPPLKYPRKCACGVEVWSNPIPVAVALVPIEDGGRTGLMVIRRGIEPRKGFLALAGGFLEDHETWQQGAAREVREETDIVVDPAELATFWFTSTEPKPNRVLLFATARPQAAQSLPAFTPRGEASERGAVFGPDGLSDVFAFPLHRQAVERWFAARGITGAHAYRTI